MLAGTRVLVVEDEVILSMALEDMLASLGCAIVGSAASLGDALQKVATLDFDLAIIDLNLAGARGERIVDEVASRKIPLIITSGYELGLHGERKTHMLLPKPYTLEQLRLAILLALGRRAEAAELQPGGQRRR